jgi:wyosine [tRNA(Phe)-imidazoG37] synthetase (radical SAM superfamily)
LKKAFKYLYGPVPSWRLGSSLGIDPLSQGEKVCSFDCSYCQIGRTRVYTLERKSYVAPEAICRELNRLPAVDIDFITISGTGEPTLAANLGRIIEEIRKIRRESIAVLTNSTMLQYQDVRDALMNTDFVVAKLDAFSPESLQAINRPAPGITFEHILTGLKQFRDVYGGRLALQIMFIDENKDGAAELAALARDIQPNEVQINTPLRPSRVEPLSRDTLAAITPRFRGMKAISVYETPVKVGVRPLSGKDTLKRRGKI